MRRVDWETARLQREDAFERVRTVLIPVRGLSEFGGPAKRTLTLHPGLPLREPRRPRSSRLASGRKRRPSGEVEQRVIDVEGLGCDKFLAEMPDDPLSALLAQLDAPLPVAEKLIERIG